MTLRPRDAAVLIEVFEHVPDPVDLLKGIGKRLPSGGMLYLTTPNFNALSRWILGGDWSVLNREHVTLATARGLGLALKEAGFQTLSIRSRNLNVAEIRYHLRARRRSGSSSAQEEKAPLDRHQAAADLRDRIEASPGLQFLKGIVNAGLGLTGTGDTLAAWARKGG